MNRFEKSSDREVARDMQIPESKVKDRRKEQGFLKLDDFTEDSNTDDKISIDAELGEMEKRKLQGHLGEKITSLMQNRVKGYLGSHIRSDWILRDKLQLISSSSASKRYWASGRPRQGSIKVNGRSVKHTGKSVEEVTEYLEERCVVAKQGIFEKFREVRNPFIDFNFYAVKEAGRKKVGFTVEDYSKNAIGTEDTLTVELPVIEDFKIIMLEVKTTTGDAEKLFSKNQRSARDLAEGSPFLDFFSLRVDKEFSDLGLPDNFSLEVEKHS